MTKKNPPLNGCSPPSTGDTLASMGDTTFRTAHCGNCAGSRECSVKGMHHQSFNDEEFGHSEATWRILECTECKSVFIEIASTNDEKIVSEIGLDGEEQEVFAETKYYWPQIRRNSIPPWFMQYVILKIHHKMLRRALVEIYAAIESDLHLLSAIGIQRCFEIASEVLGVDPNLDFDAKLDELVKRAQLGVLDRGKLNVIARSGQPTAATARLPSKLEVCASLLILEDFILDMIVKPSRDTRLAAMIEMAQSRSRKA